MFQFVNSVFGRRLAVFFISTVADLLINRPPKKEAKQPKEKTKGALSPIHFRDHR